MFNTRGLFTLDCSLFGSLVTDMSPTDLPIGASPANSDAFYLPGGIFTRPALQRIMNSQSGGGPTIMSVANFPLPLGDFRTVYLDSTGNLTYNDPLSPLTPPFDNITEVAAGSQFKSEIYGGKMWFAFYNPTQSAAFADSPFVGTDIPRYYDGQNVWRVTSDAPGGGLSFTSNVLPAVDLSTLARSGNIVTVELTGTSPGSPTSLKAGYWVSISDTDAVLGSVPQGAVPNTTNELFQAMGGSATFQGDGTGNVVVSTSSPITDLPVGAWFYYFTNQPPGVQLISFSFPDSDHVTFQVASNPFTVNQQVQITGATVGTIATFVGDPVLTISSVTGTSFTAPLINNGGSQTLSAGTATIVGSYGYGYAQVTAVTNDKTFVFFTPGNGLTTAITGIVYDIFGIQPNTSAAGQGISQSFQILAVNTTSTPNTISWYQNGPNNAYTGGDTLAVTPTTAIAPGTRQAVLIFKSLDGALTAPSVPVTITANGGSSYLSSSELAIGPAGTAQRIVAFTASGGSDYFYITSATIPTVAGLPPLTSQGTIINDNTTTSGFVFDFTDEALLASTQIDVEGNDLFNQDNLSPCLGVIEYQGRLGWWGEINNLKNLVNPGFDGGYTGTLGSTQPLGWTIGDSSGALIQTNPAYLGFSYRMNTGFVNQITQSLFQDYYGAPIASPSTFYFMRFKAYASEPGQAGSLLFEMYSPSQGIISTASIFLGDLPSTSEWINLEFNDAAPDSIPSDLELRIRLSVTTPGQGYIVIDELEMIDANYPVLFDQMILSYYQNEFGYDLITGIVSVDPSEPLTAAFRQRGSLYMLGDTSLFQTINNGTTEPNSWNTNQYSSYCGCSGPNAVDFGEDTAWWGGRYGGRTFDGNPVTKKITQALSSIWESINWTDQIYMWMKNDPVDRLLLFGIPTNGSIMPNQILAMSYRLSDATYNVPDEVHISQFTGKIIDTDLGRRWTPWQLTLNCAAMCNRVVPSGGLAPIITFGAGNGLAPGQGVSFDNLYNLDTTNYPPLTPSAEIWRAHDDDYGRIDSFYTTYFWFPKDVDQNPVLSLYRKLYSYMSLHLTGVGSFTITPFVDSLANVGRTLPAYTLTLADPGFDIEFHPNVRGDRVAWSFKPVPLPGSIDAAMSITHLQVSGRVDRVFPIRGSQFGGGIV